MDERVLMPSETLIDDRRDFTTSSVVRPEPGGDGGFTVDGPGMLDTVIVRADSDNFNVKAETDRATLIDDSFDTLKTISADLTHISAYDDGAKRVVVLEDYPFKEFARVEIDPNESITFDRVRTEWILGVPVSY